MDFLFLDPNPHSSKMLSSWDDRWLRKASALDDRAFLTAGFEGLFRFRGLLGAPDEPLPRDALSRGLRNGKGSGSSSESDDSDSGPRIRCEIDEAREDTSPLPAAPFFFRVGLAFFLSPAPNNNMFSSFADPIRSASFRFAVAFFAAFRCGTNPNSASSCLDLDSSASELSDKLSSSSSGDECRGFLLYRLLNRPSLVKPVDPTETLLLPAAALAAAAAAASSGFTSFLSFSAAFLAAALSGTIIG